MKYLIAAILTALPSITFAMCSGHTQASSCAEGYTWDSKAEACVEQTNA